MARTAMLRTLLPLAGVAATLGALSTFAPLRARDDFLRATNRDLTARERLALDDRITDLGNPDPNVRSRAIRRIVAIGRPSVPALFEALRLRSDPKLRRNVCLALGALGDPTSLALLEHWFLDENPGEEPARATLFALARGRSAVTPELSERLRKLIADAPLATVRECALLCAGSRAIAGLPDLLKGPLQSERSARVRGCMLVALAESGDPAAGALVAPFLDGRKVRDEKLRRAALYAVARLADPALLAPLLKFEPDDHEVAAYVVALGAVADPAAVERLGALLLHERDHAVAAVYSLARQPTAESKEWLLRALRGEFSDAVRSEAALAVVDLTDQQRFLPPLRELATARAADPAKAKALLALARIGDGEAAATIAEALPLWKDRELLERGLLLCATALPDRPLEELLPQARAAPVLPLWQEIEAIQSGRRAPWLLKERIAVALTAARADWTLAADDLRMATLNELLELDKVVFAEPRDGDNPPPDGGAQPQGRGKQDTARIELDLRQWLIDYPPFALADPFGG